MSRTKTNATKKAMGSTGTVASEQTWKQKIEATGAKPIWPPRKLGKMYRSIANPDETKPVLIALLYTPEEYVREVMDSHMLKCIVNGAYASDFYSLSPRRLKSLEAIIEEWINQVPIVAGRKGRA